MKNDFSAQLETSTLEYPENGQRPGGQKGGPDPLDEGAAVPSPCKKLTCAVVTSETELLIACLEEELCLKVAFSFVGGHRRQVRNTPVC